jgi:hypothetical protein
LLVCDSSISPCSTDSVFFIVYTLLRLPLPSFSASLEGAVDAGGAEGSFGNRRHTGGGRGGASYGGGARRVASGVLMASIIIASL